MPDNPLQLLRRNPREFIPELGADFKGFNLRESVLPELEMADPTLQSRYNIFRMFTSPLDLLAGAFTGGTGSIASGVLRRGLPIAARQMRRGAKPVRKASSKFLRKKAYQDLFTPAQGSRRATSDKIAAGALGGEILNIADQMEEDDGGLLSAHPGTLALYGLAAAGVPAATIKQARRTTPFSDFKKRARKKVKKEQFDVGDISETVELEDTPAFSKSNPVSILGDDFEAGVRERMKRMSQDRTLEFTSPRRRRFESVGAAGAPGSPEEIFWRFMDYKELPGSDSEDLPKLYKYMLEQEMIPHRKGKITPTQMLKDMVNFSHENRGKFDLEIDPNEPFRQAWFRYQNHLNTFKNFEPRPGLVQQGEREWTKYRKLNKLGDDDSYKQLRADLVKRPGAVTKFFGNLNQLTKQYIIASGIPLTGLNIHGYSMAVRAFGDKHNSFWRAMSYLVNPNKATDFKNTQDLIEAQRAGVNFSTERGIQNEVLMREASWEDIVGKNKLSHWMDAFGQGQEKLFGAPLFQEIIPALKLHSFKGWKDELLAAGLDAKEAEMKAAKNVNNFYGGINMNALVHYDSKGNLVSRSSEIKNLSRALILASDWFETTRRFAVGSTPKKALEVLNRFLPEGKTIDTLDLEERQAVQHAVKNYMTMFVAANVFQKATTGEFIYQNPAGKKWDLKTGIKDSKGKDIYVPLGLGTAVDFLKIPTEIGLSAVEGDLSALPSLAQGRTSQPAKFALNLYRNADYLGRPLLGDDMYGRPMSFGRQAANLGRETMDMVIPQYFDAATRLGMGDIGPSQALAQGIELPLRFNKPYYPNRRRRTRRRSR